jgi:hypothetical protein
MGQLFDILSELKVGPSNANLVMRYTTLMHVDA